MIDTQEVTNNHLIFLSTKSKLRSLVELKLIYSHIHQPIPTRPPLAIQNWLNMLQ